MIYKSCIRGLIYLAFILFGTNQLYSQDAWYQDKSGPVPWYYSQKKVVVKLKPELNTNINSFLRSDPAFDTTKTPEPTPDGFYAIFLKSGTNVGELLARLDTNSSVEIANPIYLSSPTDSLEAIANDKVSVKFKSGLSRSVIDSLNLVNKVTIVDSVWADSSWFVLKVTDQTGKSVLQIANIYEQSTNTDFAIPSFLIELQLHYLPSDSFFNNQWNFNNTGQTGGTPDADVDAVEGWQLGFGDSTIIVADIDEGVEGHEDLPASRLFDGYDYAGTNRDIDTLGDSDPSPGDWCAGHGMATSGLIAASHNSFGVAGLAPNVKIMPIKIFDNSRCPRGTKVTNVAKALLRPLILGAKIANNSWGYSTCDSAFSTLKEVRYAVNYLSRKVLVIFSAGNTYGCVAFPANLKSVLAVGATDKFDVKWNYSPSYSTGDSMDLVAPSGQLCLAGDVWTMDISGSRGFNPQSNCDSCLCPTISPLPELTANLNYTSRFGGTSAAAPQVSGVAALLMSYAKKSSVSNRKNLTLDDYKKILKFSTDDKGAVGWDASYGQGRLNAMKAMVEIARGDVNKDGKVLLPDVVLLVNYVFSGGPAPTPLRSLGDVTCDGSVNLSDIVYLKNFIFSGGPPPAIHCYKFY